MRTIQAMRTIRSACMPATGSNRSITRGSWPGMTGPPAASSSPVKPAEYSRHVVQDRPRPAGLQVLEEMTRVRGDDYRLCLSQHADYLHARGVPAYKVHRHARRHGNVAGDQIDRTGRLPHLQMPDIARIGQPFLVRDPVRVRAGPVREFLPLDDHPRVRHRAHSARVVVVQVGKQQRVPAVDEYGSIRRQRQPREVRRVVALGTGGVPFQEVLATDAGPPTVLHRVHRVPAG